MTPMGAVEQPGGQFTFGLGYSADDEELLRSIARIATCYARHVGVNVDRSEAALRFARGEQVDRCPVGPPRGDVVQTLGMPEHPLYHAVFLGRVAPSAPLLAYVVLFQFCEFIVEFTGDYPEHRLPTGHYQSLVSGLVETHPFTWVLAAEDGTEWIRERKLAADRLEARCAPLRHYMAKFDRLWIDRAIAIGGSRYFRAKDGGGSHQDASTQAQQEANRVLEKYDLRFEQMEFAGQ